MQLTGFPSAPPEACVSACLQAVRRLGPTHEPNRIVIDSADYQCEVNVLDEFRDFAFSWVSGRPTDRVPEYLRDHMSEPGCDSIVWLSRKAIDLPSPHFLWVVAHELRHVFQSRTQWPEEQTRQATRELRREAEFRSMTPSIFGPDELDAELCALHVVAAELGNEERDYLLFGSVFPRYPNPVYGRFLMRLAEKLNAPFTQ